MSFRTASTIQGRGTSNFDAYNSVENAADVNAVREALGYDQIIYYGASYGSQLGQHVMRDFPEILEAVVLDGAATLARKSWFEDRALDAQWGIDNLTAMCEADAKCTEAYDIPALVDAALALFDNGPLPYTYTDPNDPSLTVEGEVTLDDMVSFIYGNQGSLAGIAGLPSYLSGLVDGGAEAVAAFLGTQKGGALLASRTATTGRDGFAHAHGHGLFGRSCEVGRRSEAGRSRPLRHPLRPGESPTDTSSSAR